MPKLLVEVLIWLILHDFLAAQMEVEDDIPLLEDRAPLDFAFVALLYNSQMSNRTCTGALISMWWVLDNCEDYPGYEYQYFKVGWIGDDTNNTAIYEIKETVRHEGYKRVDVKSDKFDAKLLFAAENALYLHRSTKEIQCIPELVRAIKLPRKSSKVSRGYAVYMNTMANTVAKKFLKFLKKDKCNTFFESYFDAGQQMQLGEREVCVNTAGINHNQCCNSQAFLVVDNILYGIMAWSTGCSKEFGVDPWVYSSLAYYYQWIKEHSDLAKYYEDCECKCESDCCKRSET